jgi:NAD(P)-dependent dehydrogenase (short-subunit alcohol dehydrogenase family)
MNFKEMLDLKGKTAIVTGGGRGIGKFIATGLAEAGANLMLASRKVQNCEKTASELKSAHGIRAVATKMDVSIEADVQLMLDMTIKEFGTVDILVNNAGITWGAPTLDYPQDKWDKIFDVNVRGAWMISQRVARIMKEKGGGKIINISSIMGSRGSMEEVHPAVAYNSSKAAINLLTMNLAIKLARYKINVNAIAPGFFNTDMMAYIFKPEMKPILDAMIGFTPLQKIGDEDDIKALAVFLASKASDFITGAVIPLDGGLAAK